AHEPLIKAAALNHISPYFADVVWEGLSTAHVRDGLEGHIELDQLRRISLTYPRSHLTSPVRLSPMLVDEFRRRNIEHDLHVLPCGHYSTGVTPFKWLDGVTLCRFFDTSLL